MTLSVHIGRPQTSKAAGNQAPRVPKPKKYRFVSSGSWFEKGRTQNVDGCVQVLNCKKINKVQNTFSHALTVTCEHVVGKAQHLEGG